MFLQQRNSDRAHTAHVNLIYTADQTWFEPGEGLGEQMIADCGWEK